MPSKTYYLDPARTDALTVEWGFLYRNFTVRYAGQELTATNPDTKIAQGRQYPLPDGRMFSAQLREDRWPQQLELLLDGQPVPGSGTHPVESLKQAWYTLLFVGALSMGLGALAEFGRVEVLQQNGVGWGSIIEGAIFLGLGWLGYAKRSAPALTTALVLLVLDGVVSFKNAMLASHTPGIGFLMMRFFFCVAVFRGIKAAKQLRIEEAIIPEPLQTGL
ncbi:hypothetical protein [Hymenobacter properus]|uniref:Uncharacterized protein n=1 Tax=Hymenobacter properus TaxID=2791026 RepID=A0A931BF73_9BACT|nr:hypothetical protein [Hymenobacter properus]MBF9141182.1 hypothetical protein [Hymenobacter properus]MBR7719991.1 hypothetical protein [Microvirga sp. SRT04]